MFFLSGRLRQVLLYYHGFPIKHMFYRQLLIYLINRSSYLDPVCPKFISMSECYEKSISNFQGFIVVSKINENRCKQTLASLR